MLVILSPAKRLDFATPPATARHSMPGFLKESKQLIERLRQLGPDDISGLMHISTRLGDLNYERYAQWHPDFNPQNAKPAALAFNGDVYAGLDAGSMTARDFTWAQRHVRILSGLYGLLRPLDLIQPYRLEMGTRLKTARADDLYGFWGDKLTCAVNEALGQQKHRVLVNLASNEYYNVLDPERIDARIVTPTFKQLKGGRYRFVSFFAKKARGTMTRYIVDERIRTIKGLKEFDRDGYTFSDSQSRGDHLVFLRD